MNSSLNSILTQLKQVLTDLYGDRLRHLTLFGSQARGDNEPGSDIDVLVVLKSLVNPGEEIKRTGNLLHECLAIENHPLAIKTFKQHLRKC